MKYFILLLIIIGLFLQGCNYENIKNKEEEIPVYKREREFVYSVTHFNDKGKQYLKDTLILRTWPKVFSEKYGQTKSSWICLGEKRFQSYSGITENDTVVWIHPPRKSIYRKLELTPFPMVKLPLVIGSKWTWKLLVGGHYSLKGYAVWQKSMSESFESVYQISRQKSLSTNLGELDCYEITSICSNRFRKTELTAFYNEDYGFVRLQYETIDNERIIMELIKSKILPLKIDFNLPQSHLLVPL